MFDAMYNVISITRVVVVTSPKIELITNRGDKKHDYNN